MAEKRPPIPKNEEAERLVAARQARDMEGFISRYEKILEQRETAYAEKLAGLWKTVTENISKELFAIYKEIENLQGSSIAGNPVNSAKLRNLQRNSQRLRDLQQQVASRTDVSSQERVLTNNLAYTYTDSYYFHAFAVEQAARVSINVPLLSASQVIGAIINPWLPDARNYGSRLRSNTAFLAAKMEATILQAVGNGWDWNKTARRIQETAGEGYYNAVRLARTELNRAANQGATQLYMENADILDGKRWNATLDSRTAPKDAKNDGKVYDLAYDTPELPGRAGERIPNHPNCRCKWTPVISSLGVSTRERIARGGNDSPTEFGERTYTKARNYEEYAKERGLPPLDERLANENPNKYLRGGEDRSAFEGVSGIVKTTAQLAAEMVSQNAQENASKAKGENWVSLVQEKIAAGVTSEQAAVALGNIVRLRVNAEIEGVLSEIKAELDLLSSEQKFIEKVWDATDLELTRLESETMPRKADSEEIRELMGKIDRLRKERGTLELQWKEKRTRKLDLEEKKVSVMAEAVKHVLGQVRPMGAPKGQAQDWKKGSVLSVKKAIEDAYQWFPTAWVEKSYASQLVGRKVKRGYYFPLLANQAEIYLSGDTSDELTHVAIHELGHRMEHIFPIIRALEHEFYARRTAGEDLKWLGGSYGKKEKTRFDNFQVGYMGKDYGNQPDSYYEILSMGVESLFHGSRGVDMNADVDYYNFILGVLAGI